MNKDEIAMHLTMQAMTLKFISPVMASTKIGGELEEQAKANAQTVAHFYNEVLNTLELKH